MKLMNLVLSLILACGLAACAQIDPVPRDQLAANLAPVLKIEERAARVKHYSQMLGSMAGMSKEKSDHLKAHYDIYYVYWMAAIFHLARGNMESYSAHVKLAERELDAMEKALKDKFAELGEANSEREDQVSRLEL